MVISQTRHFSLICATKEETGLEKFKDLPLVNQMGLAEARAGGLHPHPVLTVWFWAEQDHRGRSH